MSLKYQPNVILHMGFTVISVAPRNIRMVPAGTIEVSAGDNVQFDCLAEGSPLPFVVIRKQKADANRKRNI